MKKEESVEVNFRQLWYCMCDIGQMIVRSPELRKSYPDIKIRVHENGIDLLRVNARPPETEEIRRASVRCAGSHDRKEVISSE